MPRQRPPVTQHALALVRGRSIVQLPGAMPRPQRRVHAAAADAGRIASSARTVAVASAPGGRTKLGSPCGHAHCHELLEPRMNGTTSRPLAAKRRSRSNAPKRALVLPACHPSIGDRCPAYRAGTATLTGPRARRERGNKAPRAAVILASRKATSDVKTAGQLLELSHRHKPLLRIPTRYAQAGHLRGRQRISTRGHFGSDP